MSRLSRSRSYPKGVSSTIPLLVATGNGHKTEEIAAFLGDSFRVSDLSSLPQAPDIEETGETFLENATIKAVEVSRVVDGLVLADDSGLEVDALGGRPGVWSARFAGEGADDRANNARLLDELAGVGPGERSGRFRCVMVIAEAGRVLTSFSGSVEGRIAGVASGGHGFGYDPLFVPDGYEETFAELGPVVKNRLSHRARAMEQVHAWLRDRHGNQD